MLDLPLEADIFYGLPLDEHAKIVSFRTARRSMQSAGGGTAGLLARESCNTAAAWKCLFAHIASIRTYAIREDLRGDPGGRGL